MAKNYRELAARSKANWSPETHKLAAAAGEAFTVEALALKAKVASTKEDEEV